MAPHHHPFFGGGAAFNPAAEFNGLVRLLDSAAAEFFPGPRHHGGHHARRGGSFNPRFDVREVENGYELKGEMPGVDHGDLQIEFEDERTLVIRGSTKREFTDSNVKVVDAAEALKAVEGAADTTNDDAASVHSDKSSNYRKASVEDDYVDAGAEATDKTTAAETEKPTTTTDAADSTDKVAPAPEQQEPQFRYWVNERSVGEFERRFAFPGRVDQDAVTASLKNGILSVVVPKIVDKAARKIEIQ